MYISQIIIFDRVCSHVEDFNARNKCITVKLLKHGYQKGFFQVLSPTPLIGFKIQCRILHQGLSEPEFYGDLVYKFKKIMGRTDFSDQFRKITIRHKRIGYNLYVMQQSACLVVNPITVDNFAALFKGHL